MDWRIGRRLIWLIVGIFFVCGRPAWAANEAAKKPQGAVEKAAKEVKPEPEAQGVKIDSSVIQAIEALSVKDPAIALRLYYMAAEGYQAQNQPERAIAIYESALKTFPKQEDDVLNRLIGLYQVQAKYDEVIKTANSLAKRHPDNTYYQQTIANANFSKGDKDAGIAVWKAVIAVHQDDANLHIQYAQVLQAQGKPDEAIEQFKAAVALKPLELGFVQQLGQAYINNKKLDEAKQVYEKLISAVKEPWIKRDAGRQLLNIAQQQKNLDALLTSIEASLAKNASDLNAYWQLIEGYAMNGKNDLMAAILERAVKQFPDDRELGSRLISAYQMQGKWDKAIDMLKGQIAKNANDTGLRMQLAQAYANSGKFKEAVAALEEAAKADPNNSVMYAEQIADVYVRANQLDDAIKQYEALKVKATEDWRKTNYTSRVDQLKQQKEQMKAAKAAPSNPVAATPAAKQ